MTPAATSFEDPHVPQVHALRVMVSTDAPRSKPRVSVSFAVAQRADDLVRGLRHRRGSPQQLIQAVPLQLSPPGPSLAMWTGTRVVSQGERPPVSINSCSWAATRACKGCGLDRSSSVTRTRIAHRPMSCRPAPDLQLF